MPFESADSKNAFEAAFAEPHLGEPFEVMLPDLSNMKTR